MLTTPQNQPEYLEETFVLGDFEKFEVKLETMSQVIDGFKTVQQKLSNANIDLGALVGQVAGIVRVSYGC